MKGVFGGCGLSVREEWVGGCVYFSGGCGLSMREDWVGVSISLVGVA